MQRSNRGPHWAPPHRVGWGWLVLLPRQVPALAPSLPRSGYRTGQGHGHMVSLL